MDNPRIISIEWARLDGPFQVGSKGKSKARGAPAWPFRLAAVEPNETALAPRNPVPVTVTDVPPASGPAMGLSALTDGAL